MHWFKRIAFTEIERIKTNIARLKQLQSTVHDLAYYVVASNGGGYQVLQELLNDNLVKGRPNVLKKLESALFGENNSKIALDAPMKFQSLMLEAHQLIGREIGKEKQNLRELAEAEEESKEKSPVDTDEE